MKKTTIFDITVVASCFLLWFFPIEQISNNSWVFSIRVLFESAKNGFPLSLYLREFFLILLGCISIATTIAHIIKSNKFTKTLSTVATIAYVVFWVIALFVDFPHRYTIYVNFIHGSNVMWLVLYFALLLPIPVLTILQWLPPRRPSKTAALEARVAELEQQVDELKNKD